MNVEQMIAWLTIEGYLYYKSPNSSISDGARKSFGTEVLVMRKDDGCAKFNVSPAPSDAWPNSDIRSWDEAPDNHVAAFYKKAIGETS